MSLLLQALKQIESKSPAMSVETRVASGSSRPRDLAAASVEEEQPAEDALNDARAFGQKQLIGFPPIVVVPVGGTSPSGESSDNTIHLIRCYNDSETAIEIAVADPLDMDALPCDLAKVEPVRDERFWRASRKDYRYFDRIVNLLPDQSRGVIAVLSVEGIEAAPLVLDVCEALAAHDMGDVLAIAEGDSIAPVGKPTFRDVVDGSVIWREALASGSHNSIGLIAPGDLCSLGNGAQRRLLRTWDELGKHFTFIVLNVPAGESSDAMPVLATCDAVFIAIRLNETNRRDAEHLVEKVRQGGCQLCGCLVVDPYP
jgi:hypothetical protein